jgi:CDP-4-dehydro-6-deoxyglucose reductase, E1
MLKYYLAKDTIDDNDIDGLIKWLKTYPRLTMGDLTRKFEEKWSKWLGKKYAVFCNSGSSANLLMYAALLNSGKLKNKKIIVPCCAWPTTIAPGMQLGFKPIMCEADPDTFGLDLNHLEKLLIKHKPSSVILVQVLGVPHKMSELMKLKKKYGFYLLEDACAAVGAKYNNKKVGTFGDMSSISTFFGHQFSTVEGGIVSTDDRDLYNLLLRLRSHGWGKQMSDKDHKKLLKKHEIDTFGSPFVFYEPGYNLRPTDIGAFIGIHQLDKIEWLVKRRYENHKLYKKLLENYLGTQAYDSKSIVCSIHFCAVASDSKERRAIVAALQKEKIETRLFTAGNQGKHPYWYKSYNKFSAPTADKLYSNGFFLPNNPSLELKDVKYISEVVIKSIKKYRGSK